MAPKSAEEEFRNTAPDGGEIPSVNFGETTTDRSKVEKQAEAFMAAGYGVGIDIQEAQFSDDKERYRLVYWDRE